MFSSPLQRAITRGMKPEGDLAAELQKLEDYPVKSRKDARAICKALGKLPLQGATKPGITSPLHALVGLFQDVAGPDSPAFEVLYTDGVPQLIQIYDTSIQQNGDKDDILYVLKILAMYGSLEGAQRIVEAARRPFEPESYMWHPILSAFSGGHPQRDYVYGALSDPPPAGFIAMALLDSANQTALEGELPQHPFDSPAGWEQLQNWLEDQDPDHFSYAISTTAALPFLSNPARDQLLALAMDHADSRVQLEGAWAAGKLGRSAGLRILARSCLDLDRSETARQYLVELGREDLVPPEALEPSFRAKSNFAHWLAHPNELGQPPDELEIVDHRHLAWPPEYESKPFWLIKYLLRDRTGLEEDDIDCGLVGSMTWCFFTRKMHERPPEDAYAIHCYWETQHGKLIEETEVTDASEYAGMLGQWKGASLEGARITHIAELSPQLNVPGRIVALASATLHGEEGWAVLDGPRSAWYPKSEQPNSTDSSIALSIHVGRQLLGFRDATDRKKYLVENRSRREPQQIIATYEKLLAEAASSPPNRQETLLGSLGRLSKHFEAYIEARATLYNEVKAKVAIDLYERLLDLAKNVDKCVRDEVHDSLGVLGRHFESHVDALVACGRSNEIAALIELFEPFWDHNRGYGQLGMAAFKAGLLGIAERFFLKLREQLVSYYRSEKMSALAQIWQARGEVEQARELLVDCLRKMVIEIRESKYISDREMHVKEFQHHRTTYLRLFPNGEKELAKLGIPADPL